MSEYTERYVRFGHETSWGVYASTFNPIEYCLSFDATSTEHRIEEDIISASRQARARTWAQREVVGSFECNFLSPRLMYYALGRSVSDASSPYTVEVSGTLSVPSFSIERGLRGAGSTIYTGYMGCKIDRFELEVEREEDIVQRVDWVGKNNTFPSYNWNDVSGAPSWSASPFAYYEACLKWGNSTIRLNRVVIRIENNLTARYAGFCTGGSITPFEIREGSQVISGEFLVDQNVDIYARDFARSREEGTITVLIGNPSRGTVSIICRRVALESFDESIRGREPYEVSFPFVARPSGPSEYDAISVTYESTIAGTIHDMPV